MFINLMYWDCTLWKKQVKKWKRNIRIKSEDIYLTKLYIAVTHKFYYIINEIYNMK